MRSTVQESFWSGPSFYDKKLKNRSGNPTVQVSGFTEDDIRVTKAGYKKLLRVKSQEKFEKSNTSDHVSVHVVSSNNAQNGLKLFPKHCVHQKRKVLRVVSEEYTDINTQSSVSKCGN